MTTLHSGRSMTLVASSRPPRPDLEHRHVDAARRRNATNAIAVTTSKKVQLAARRASTRSASSPTRVLADLVAVDADALGEARQVRRGVEPGAQPAARSAASTNAAVEPLPLVPPTCTTAQLALGIAERARSARAIASSPGRTPKRRSADQPLQHLVVRHRGRSRAAARARGPSSATRPRQRLLQLPALDDRVDHAVLRAGTPSAGTPRAASGGWSAR